MPMQTPMAPERRQYASPKDTRTRWSLLALTGALMLIILGGVLWGSGMLTNPMQSRIAEPVYLRPDNLPSDVAATGVIRDRTRAPAAQ